jgi:hypothetical protein
MKYSPAFITEYSSYTNPRTAFNPAMGQGAAPQCYSMPFFAALPWSALPILALFQGSEALAG